jgi:hypothetical protein
MADLVLNRYSLVARQHDLEPLYPASEVWSGIDPDGQRPVTVISYPLEVERSGCRTARALWSAELRKLFRLSCQPFDPSLVGFLDGGYDEPGQRLILIMEDVRLPDAEGWLQGEEGRPCAAQWRGTNAGNRAQLWSHIAGLYQALASVHESRIVHRRIMPRNGVVARR